MGPVGTAELQRLSASGKLTPTDLVWKDGMPDWIRASAAPELSFDDGLITAEPADAAGMPDIRRRADDDRPRRIRQRDTVEFDDHEYRSSRRRRRRAAEKAGMSPGLKAGLIMGGIFLRYSVARGRHFRIQVPARAPVAFAPVNFTTCAADCHQASAVRNQQSTPRLSRPAHGGSGGNHIHRAANQCRSARRHARNAVQGLRR